MWGYSIRERKISPVFICLLLALLTGALIQGVIQQSAMAEEPPPTEWDKTYGGPQRDAFRSFQPRHQPVEGLT